MKANERAMLEFTTKWCRFGGGDEYLFPEFGLTPTAFYRRVLKLVEELTNAEIDSETRRYLHDFCAAKIAGAMSGPGQPSARLEPITPNRGLST